MIQPSWMSIEITCGSSCSWRILEAPSPRRDRRWRRLRRWWGWSPAGTFWWAKHVWIVWIVWGGLIYLIGVYWCLKVSDGVLLSVQCKLLMFDGFSSIPSLIWKQEGRVDGFVKPLLTRWSLELRLREDPKENRTVSCGSTMGENAEKHWKTYGGVLKWWIITLKWVVYNGKSHESPIKVHDLGGTPMTQEPPICLELAGEESVSRRKITSWGVSLVSGGSPVSEWFLKALGDSTLDKKLSDSWLHWMCRKSRKSWFHSHPQDLGHWGIM